MGGLLCGATIFLSAVLLFLVMVQLLDPQNQVDEKSYTEFRQLISDTSFHIAKVEITRIPEGYMLTGERKLSPQEDATETRLAPQYSYDSTAANLDPTINPKNQLPPVVQLTVVAVDEATFGRIQAGAVPPDFGKRRQNRIWPPREMKAAAHDLALATTRH